MRINTYTSLAASVSIVCFLFTVLSADAAGSGDDFKALKAGFEESRQAMQKQQVANAASLKDNYVKSLQELKAQSDKAGMSARRRGSISRSKG